MAKSPAGNDTLLSLLPVDIADGLFAHASSIKLAAGQVLFTAGDPGDGCYGIEEGLLKVHVISSSGGDRILAILGPGAIVGELSCSTVPHAQPRSPLFARRNSLSSAGPPSMPPSA